MKILLNLVLLFVVGLVSGQSFNEVVFDEKAQKDVMKGACDIEGLQTTVWTDVYDAAYTQYQPDMEVVAKLISVMQNIEIIITLGSWCGDSKEQVPAFFKILDQLNFNMSKLTIIALDRNFDSGENGIRPYNTEKVPTFIFLSGSVELGRIIETPQQTLEKDMAVIFGVE